MIRPRLPISAPERVPLAVWLTSGPLAVAGLFGPNPVLTVGAALLLAWFFLLLWRPGEPPILLLALGIQWLQVTVKIWQADVEGVPIQAVNDWGGDIELATGLSMVALAVLALGMRLALARYAPADAQLARREAMLFSPNRLWRFYLVALGGSVAVLTLAWRVPGITQLAIALANLKWAVYFALAYVCFLRPERLGLLLVAFGIEVTMSLGAYFSSFKTVFYVTIVAFVASGRNLSGRQIGLLLPLMSILIVMSLAWTSIKIGYRDYLSEGVRAQIVTRGYAERMEELYEMVSNLEAQDMEAAARDMVERISYVAFLGRVLDNVPKTISHTDGSFWGSAVTHILMPRLLFPDKPELRNDSRITYYYTGLKFADDTQGTTVSIGYVAESYIDFGIPGMFAPVLVLGLLWGGMYRYLVTRRGLPRILGYGLAVGVLLGAILFEANGTKLLGGMVTSFLVAFLVEKFLLRKLVPKLLLKVRARTDQSPFATRQV